MSEHESDGPFILLYCLDLETSEDLWLVGQHDEGNLNLGFATLRNYNVIGARNEIQISRL